MNRDEDLISIRPTLDLAGIDKKPLEVFQNDTLRPILKLQHELTLSLLRNHKNYKADKLSNLTTEQYHAFITKFAQTNLDLKNQLIGTTIGLFTSIEFEFYKEHKKELNKRLIQMQLKRFVDTVYG